MKIKSDKFLKLKNKWYEKLKQEGFDDIESTRGTEDQWLRHSVRIRPNDADYSFQKIESRQDYYRIAGFFLHDHKFENDFEHDVWEYHSNGNSIRDMVDLFKERNIETYRTKVNEVLIELKEKMLKLYGVVKNGK